MWIELITVGIMVGQYIYYRMTDSDESAPIDRVRVPKVTDGTSIPMLYGRCRVDSPLVVWQGNQQVQRDVYRAGMNFYEMDLLFVLGIPYPSGVTKLQGIYIGEQRRDNVGNPTNLTPNLSQDDGLNNVVAGSSDPPLSTDPEFTQLWYNFGDGRFTQTMVGTQVEEAIEAAGGSAENIPGYRNYAIVFTPISRNTNVLPAIGFEISSYPNLAGPGPLTDTEMIGLEMNPADVIYDILTGTFGKLALNASLVDIFSFADAAVTLSAEGNGFSGAIDSSGSASDVIQDVLRQIDGVLYEHPATGLIHLKLIRPDYIIADLPRIDPNNCTELQDFAAGGWTNVVNKVRVVYKDRLHDYQETSVTAHNQANAVSNGNSHEVVLSFPYVCTRELALKLVSRELSVRSRPIMKCRAIVTHAFWNTVPGDAVVLNWPEYGINGMIYRVGAVNRGASGSNLMALDLIQDQFFTWNEFTSGTGLDIFPHNYDPIP